MAAVSRFRDVLVAGVLWVLGAARSAVGSHKDADGDPAPLPLQRQVILTRSATPLHALAAGWCGPACMSLDASRAGLVEPIVNFRNVQYYGLIKLGSLGQELYAVFDTGSSDVWFPRKKVTAAPSSSSMDCSESRKGTIRIEYSIGEVSGGICRDDVAIAGSVLHSMPFIAADHTADLNQMHFDGVFGLAFPSLSHMRAGESPVEQLEDQLGMRSFAFILGEEEADGASRLILGPPSEPWLLGDNVTHLSVPYTQWWTYIGAMIVGSTVLLQDSVFALDTGTSYLTMPATVAAALIEAMMPNKGARCTLIQQSSSKMWTCPCEDSQSAQVVYVYVNKVKFPIFPEDMIEKFTECHGPWCNCYVQIQAPIGAETMPIIIGDTFLRTVGSVYDVQHTRIGLAANPSYGPKLAESAKRLQEDREKVLGGPLLPPHRPFDDLEASIWRRYVMAVIVGLFLGILMVACMDCACKPTRPVRPEEGDVYIRI